MIEDRLARLFDFVMHEINCVGGDGDGVIVLKPMVGQPEPAVQKIAAAFDEWQCAHPHFGRWPLKRHDLGPLHVLFTDESNENLTIVAKSLGLAHPWHDVYVESWA